MPIYIYQAKDEAHSCRFCVRPFEIMQKLADPRLEVCPHCNNPIQKIITAPAIGRSKSNLDTRAKAAGFHKLKKLGKGEYEKLY